MVEPRLTTNKYQVEYHSFIINTDITWPSLGYTHRYVIHVDNASSTYNLIQLCKIEHIPCNRLHVYDFIPLVAQENSCCCIFSGHFRHHYLQGHCHPHFCHHFTAARQVIAVDGQNILTGNILWSSLTVPPHLPSSVIISIVIIKVMVMMILMITSPWSSL